MSFIQQRGKKGIWCYHWYADGKLHKQSLKTADAKVAEVLKGDEDKQRFLSKNGLPNPTARWDFYKKKYFDYAKTAKGAGTCKKEEYIIGRFEKSGDFVTLREVSKFHLESYFSKLAAESSKANANAHYRHLKPFFSKAVEWGYLPAHPFRGVKQFRLEKRFPRYLSREEIQKVFDAAKHDRPDAYLMALVLVYSGVRASELAAMKWEDIDLGQGWIKVFGKGSKERHIPLHGTLRAYFEAHTGSGYIFGNGKPLSRFTLADVFKRLYKDAGIKGANIHTLRHTFASHCVMAGIDLPSLKEMLGHTSIQTTMIYSHLARPHLQQAVQKLDLTIPK